MIICQIKRSENWTTLIDRVMNTENVMILVVHRRKELCKLNQESDKYVDFYSQYNVDVGLQLHILLMANSSLCPCPGMGNKTGLKIY